MITQSYMEAAAQIKSDLIKLVLSEYNHYDILTNIVDAVADVVATREHKDPREFLATFRQIQVTLGHPNDEYVMACCREFVNACVQHEVLYTVADEIRKRL
jgi:hypothetical protein